MGSNPGQSGGATCLPSGRWPFLGAQGRQRPRQRGQAPWAGHLPSRPTSPRPYLQAVSPAPAEGAHDLLHPPGLPHQDRGLHQGAHLSRDPREALTPAPRWAQREPGAGSAALRGRAGARGARRGALRASPGRLLAGVARRGPGGPLGASERPGGRGPPHVGRFLPPHLLRHGARGRDDGAGTTTSPRPHCAGVARSQGAGWTAGPGTGRRAGPGEGGARAGQDPGCGLCVEEGEGPKSWGYRVPPSRAKALARGVISRRKVCMTNKAAGREGIWKTSRRGLTGPTPHHRRK